MAIFDVDHYRSQKLTPEIMDTSIAGCPHVPRERSTLLPVGRGREDPLADVQWRPLTKTIELLLGGGKVLAVG